MDSSKSSPVSTTTKPLNSTSKEIPKTAINVSTNSALLQHLVSANKDQSLVKTVPSSINLGITATTGKTSPINLNNIKSSSSTSVAEAFAAVAAKALADSNLAKINIPSTVGADKTVNTKNSEDLNSAPPISLFSMKKDNNKINDQIVHTPSIITKVTTPENKPVIKTPAQIAAEGLISSLAKTDGGITLPLSLNKTTIGSPVVKTPTNDTKTLATNLIKNLQLEQKKNQLQATTSNTTNPLSTSLEKKDIQAKAAAAVASAAAALTPTASITKTQETSAANIAAALAAVYSKATVAQQKTPPQTPINQLAIQAQTQALQQQKSASKAQVEQIAKAVLAAQQAKVAAAKLSAPSTPTVSSPASTVKVTQPTTTTTTTTATTTTASAPTAPTATTTTTVTTTATTATTTTTTTTQSTIATATATTATTPTGKVVTPISNPAVAAAIAKSMSNAALNQQLTSIKTEPNVTTKNNIPPVAANNLNLSMNPALANLKAKLNMSNFALKNGIPNNMNVAAAVAANPQALQAALASGQFPKNYYNLAKINALREKQKLQQQQNFYLSQQQRIAATATLNSPAAAAMMKKELNMNLLLQQQQQQLQIQKLQAQIQAQAQAQAQAQIQAQAQAQAQTQAQTQAQAQAQAQAQTQAKAQAQTPTQTQTQNQTQAQTQAQTPAQTPAQTQTQTLAQTQTQTPAQTPAQTQAQTQAQIPAQTSAQTQVQTPVQTQAQTQAQTPAPTQTQVQTQLKAQTQTLSQVQTTQTQSQTQAQTPSQVASTQSSATQSKQPTNSAVTTTTASALSSSKPEIPQSVLSSTNSVITTTVTPTTLANNTSSSSSTIPVIKIENANNDTTTNPTINSPHPSQQQHTDNLSPIRAVFDPQKIKREMEEKRKRELSTNNETIPKDKRNIVKLKVNKKPKLKISEEDGKLNIDLHLCLLIILINYIITYKYIFCNRTGS